MASLGQPTGEFELKGIRRPLAAYNVVGALSREPECAAGRRTSLRLTAGSSLHATSVVNSSSKQTQQPDYR